MGQNSQLNLLDRFNRWMKESISVKLGSIGFLILILLIPNAWIQDLMLERQKRADEAILEVSKKWSESQTLSGPILVIPFTHVEEVKYSNGELQKKESIINAYFLPEELTISGKLDPEILHRGIFDVAVYETQLDIKASFAYPDLSNLGLENSMMKWKEAYVIMGISDLRGISDPPMLNIGTTELIAEPSNNIGIDVQKYSNEINEYNDLIEKSIFSRNGIKARMNWADKDDFNKEITLHLEIRGSNKLSFMPVGKTTKVHLSSTWRSPSFEGEFLPSNREITSDGFNADWKILHFNRPFDQEWKGDNVELPNSSFGLKLLIPVDQYQKSIRTSKYSILIILLTFISLFLVEIIKKIRIHPFQYILVGVALIIYYTLLISLSEHFGYNLAYWFSSILTVGLLGFYSKSFISNSKLSLLFTSIISIVYVFIFVIIIQQDLSLVIGSLGLFIITGLIMYFSRKVNWYGET